MHSFIYKVVTHAWFVAFLAAAFVISMLSFWARIRQEDRLQSGKTPHPTPEPETPADPTPDR